MTRKHKINDEEIMIEWFIDQNIIDTHGMSTFHFADGQSEDGRQWVASVEMFQGDVVSFMDIEQTEIVR